MDILNSTMCQASIPGQDAGTSVIYWLEADDVLKNVLYANGSYSVKYPTVINLTLVQEMVHVGENVTVKGYLTPEVSDMPVTIFFSCGNNTREIDAMTLAEGTFTASFQTENVEMWHIQATFSGDQYHFPSESTFLTVNVEEPTFLSKYGLYIGGGATAAAIAGAIIYLKKFRQ